MFDYKGKRWQRKSQQILKMDGYKDMLELRFYGRRRGGEVVHHIYPVRDYPEYAFETWNLISVSRATHNKLENRTTGELTILGKQLQRATKPGRDWRAGKIQSHNL